MEPPYRYFHGRPPSLAAVHGRDEAFKYDLWREADLGPVFDAPAQLSLLERLLLFSLVANLRPRRALEIGSYRGGSARIIVHAMDVVRQGELVMVDPAPELAPGLLEAIAHRARLLVASSPAVFHERLSPGERFDFAFVDAEHSSAAVKRDLEGLRPFLAPEGAVLLHDGLRPEVARAIDEVVAADPGLVDVGLLASNPALDADGTPFAGLRLLRLRKASQP